ncbi:hypothetical protein Hanom_Chr14g01318231 [Helianthus anomalus]
MFDLMAIDIHEFSSVWCAPPAEWVTLESIAKMKKILTSDGIVVIRFIGSEYFSFVNCIEKMKQVFWKALKIKVSQKKVLYL